MAKHFTLIVPAVLAALAATTTPASAAPNLRHNADYAATAHYAGFGQASDLQNRIAKLDARVSTALANRRISPREASGLRRDVRNLQRQFAQAKRGGLTRGEARSIEARLAQLDGALHAERHDRDNRRG